MVTAAVTAIVLSLGMLAAAVIQLFDPNCEPATGTLADLGFGEADTAYDLYALSLQPVLMIPRQR